MKVLAYLLSMLGALLVTALFFDSSNDTALFFSILTTGVFIIGGQDK